MRKTIALLLLAALASCSRSDRAPRPPWEAAPVAKTAPPPPPPLSPPPVPTGTVVDLSEFGIPATLRAPKGAELLPDTNSVRIEWGIDFVDITKGGRPAASALHENLAHEPHVQILAFDNDKDGELLTWKNTQLPVQWHVERFLTKAGISCSHTLAIESEAKFQQFLSVCASLAPRG